MKRVIFVKERNLLTINNVNFNKCCCNNTLLQFYLGYFESCVDSLALGHLTCLRKIRV